MPKDAFGNELMKPQVVPVGTTHQTPAVRNHINNVLGVGQAALTATGKPKHHRRKSASTGLPKAKRAKHKRRTSKKSGGIVKLAKGSAAAIAWGKKMHAARKKKAKKAG